MLFPVYISSDFGQMHRALGSGLSSRAPSVLPYCYHGCLPLTSLLGLELKPELRFSFRLFPPG